jgi:hypothetical protein
VEHLMLAYIIDILQALPSNTRPKKYVLAIRKCSSLFESVMYAEQFYNIGGGYFCRGVIRKTFYDNLTIIFKVRVS